MDDIINILKETVNEEYNRKFLNANVPNKRYLCKGCSNAPTFEEYCIGEGCPDAYTSVAKFCGWNQKGKIE